MQGSTWQNVSSSSVPNVPWEGSGKKHRRGQSRISQQEGRISRENHLGQALHGTTEETEVCVRKLELRVRQEEAWTVGGTASLGP